METLRFENAPLADGQSRRLAERHISRPSGSSILGLHLRADLRGKDRHLGLSMVICLLAALRIVGGSQRKPDFEYRIWQRCDTHRRRREVRKYDHGCHVLPVDPSSNPGTRFKGGSINLTAILSKIPTITSQDSCYGYPES